MDSWWSKYYSTTPISKWRKNIVIKNLSPVSDKEKTYATEEFKVNAGSGVKVYAFINPENLEIGATTNPTTLTLTTAQTLPSEPDGLAFL